LANSFQDGLQTGTFQIIARVVPPRSADLTPIVEQTSSWKGKVNTILVADNPLAMMGMSSLVVADTLKREGHDVMIAMSCRDHNRIALGSTALAAAALSIWSILCVSGDYVSFGDQLEAKPVFDLDSVQLISMIREMENSSDTDEERTTGETFSFFLGAAACATADPLSAQLMKARRKIAAGADFLITLPVFTMEQLTPFLEGVKDFPVKILAGVLLPSYQQIARYVDGSIPGTFIPKDLVNIWKDAGEETFLSTSADHTRKLISELRNSGKVAGVCISASGRESEIEGLL
jgi:5,10-methylenetetrahydrofolate reductase